MGWVAEQSVKRLFGGRRQGAIVVTKQIAADPDMFMWLVDNFVIIKQITDLSTGDHILICEHNSFEYILYGSYIYEYMVQIDSRDRSNIILHKIVNIGKTNLVCQTKTETNSNQNPW